MKKVYLLAHSILTIILLVVLLGASTLPLCTFSSEEAIFLNNIGPFELDLSRAEKVDIGVLSFLSADDDAKKLTELYMLENSIKELEITRGDSGIQDYTYQQLQNYKEELKNKTELLSAEDKERISSKLKDPEFLSVLSARIVYKLKLGSILDDYKEYDSYSLKVSYDTVGNKSVFLLVVGKLGAFIATALILIVLFLEVIFLFKKLLSKEKNDNPTPHKSVDLIVLVVLFQFLCMIYWQLSGDGIMNIGLGYILSFILCTIILALKTVLKLVTKNCTSNKKALITRQIISLASLVLMFSVSLVGFKVTGAMTEEVREHYSDFIEVSISETEIDYSKYDNESQIKEKISEIISSPRKASMEREVFLEFILLIISGCLAFLLMHFGFVKFGKKKNHILGDTILMIASLILLCLPLSWAVNSTEERVEAFKNGEAAIIFDEYTIEDSDDYKEYHELWSKAKKTSDELDFLREQDRSDENEEKAKLLKLQLRATEERIDRIENSKKSNLITCITLNAIAVVLFIACTIIAKDEKEY